MKKLFFVQERDRRKESVMTTDELLSFGSRFIKTLNEGAEEHEVALIDPTNVDDVVDHLNSLDFLNISLLPEPSERLELLLGHVGIQVDGGDDWLEGVARDYNNFEEGQDTFTIYGEEWVVLNEEEAEEWAYDYLVENIDNFSSIFLSEYTGVSEEMIDAIKEHREDSRHVITLLVNFQVDGLEGLVQEAILRDGMGEFISTYDGEEIVLSNEYSAYRLY